MDAACQVAHALSTHRANMEFDFYTAVDDLQSREETGAGMMGVVGFNAATFYRYARIDFDQLVQNLGGDLDLARKTVEGFLRAAAHAVPTGKQNSFAAQNPPSFLMAVTRDDGLSWSMSNAFEKPVYAHGEQSLLEASVQALDGYWQHLTEFYGEGPQPVVGMVGLSAPLQSLGAYQTGRFEDWVESTLDALPKE
jgi:CRISPR system Cascade subunit CasC